MTATGTRAFDLIDYVVTSLRSASGLCAPGGVTIPVYDGPVITNSDPSTYVLIGGYGFGDEVDEIATIDVDASWMSLPIGAGHREERITVPCTVTGWSGGQDWSATRSSVSGAFDKVSDCLMTRGTWDGLSAVVQIVLSNMELTQSATDLGIVVQLKFDIDATFRV